MKTTTALLLSAFSLLARGPIVTSASASPTPRTTKFEIDKRGGGELYTTTEKLQVLAAPKADSKVLDEYDKGAIMVVIGEAKGTGYLYVSPCNACEKGFVSKAEFQAKTKR